MALLRSVRKTPIQLFLTALSCCSLVYFPQIVEAAASFNEEDIKAAFLYNFADFISWPGDESRNSNTTLYYCVLSDAAVQQALDSLLAEDRGSDIQRQLVAVSDPTELSNCDLLYLGKAGTEYRDEVAALSVSEVLTVSSQDEFLEAGGMIQLVRDGNRIQVHMNLDLVNESGFQVSSQLLRLVNIFIAEKR